MSDLLIKGKDSRLKIKLKTAPQKEVVSQDELAEHLKLDSEEQAAESGLLDRLRTSARKFVENYIQQQLITATYVNYFNEFCEPLQLWYPPIQSIVHLKYKDGDGVEQTVDASDYVLDSYVKPGEITLANDATWPSTLLNQVNVIWCEFKAGFGDSVTDIDQDIKDAILLKAASMYERRIDTKETTPSTIYNLLEPYRIMLI